MQNSVNTGNVIGFTFEGRLVVSREQGNGGEHG